MNLYITTTIALLLLSIVLIANLRVKKHLHQIERVAVFIFISTVLSDFVIVVSLNYDFRDIGIDTPVMYTLNLINRLVIYPAMCVLFVNEYAGKTRLWQRGITFLKWLIIFLGTAQLFGWLELTRYIRWPLHWSIMEWIAKLLIAIAFFTLFRYLLKREQGLQQEVKR